MSDRLEAQVIDVVSKLVQELRGQVPDVLYRVRGPRQDRPLRDLHQVIPPLCGNQVVFVDSEDSGIAHDF